jgi:hypothetical protein
MELLQKFTEEQIKNQVDKARQVVENITMGNIHSNDRVRNNVESRMIYSKLLRETGLTFKYIAGTLSKDHTTIIHYINLMNNLIETEPEVNHKYAKCRDIFFAGRENHKIEFDAIKANQKLEECMERYKRAAFEKDRAISFNKKLSRLRDIVELIDSRTPKGAEQKIFMAINRMFNGLEYYKDE